MKEVSKKVKDKYIKKLEYLYITLKKEDKDEPRDDK